MITLDTNLSLICSMINVSYKKITDEYSGMSVEEILEAEAAQGNTSAANLMNDIMNNPAKLVEIFGLNNLGNKYSILSNMSTNDLDKLLPLLNTEDLTVGLKYFDKEKLLKLISKLPKEELVKFMLEMFPPQKLIEYMPKEQIDNFLQSDDLDKGIVLKHLASLPPEVLAQMLENVTGQPVKDMDPNEMINTLSSLSPKKYKDALVSLPDNFKRALILKIVTEEPKLFQLFDTEGFIKIANRKDKPDLIKAAEVIDPKELIKMLKELPKELLAVVLTQMDPQDFAEVLIKDHKDIISQIVAV